MFYGLAVKLKSCKKAQLGWIHLLQTTAFLDISIIATFLKNLWKLRQASLSSFSKMFVLENGTS